MRIRTLFAFSRLLPLLPLSSHSYISLSPCFPPPLFHRPLYSSRPAPPTSNYPALKFKIQKQPFFSFPFLFGPLEHPSALVCLQATATGSWPFFSPARNFSSSVNKIIPRYHVFETYPQRVARLGKVCNPAVNLSRLPGF